MLYKNNEIYKLTKEETKKFSKKTTYLLMPHYFKYDHQDERIRKPNSIMMEPFYILFDTESGGSTEVRYAKTTPQKKIENGNTYEMWNPSEVEFPQSAKIVVENDPEMNYFLANHPQNDANPKRDANKRSVFYPENRAELAAKNVKIAQKKFDAIAMIFHPTDGLDEKNLRLVASCYPDLVQQSQNADFTLEQLQDALRRKAEESPEFFLKSARSPRTKLKHLVNAAVAAKHLRYVPSKKTWFKVEAEQERDVIVTVKEGQDAIEKLIDYLQLDDKRGFVQYFEQQLDKDPVYSS